MTVRQGMASPVAGAHLGGPPEPWEREIGETIERVAKQGRAVIQYAAKMQELGVSEKSMAGKNNAIAVHVQSLGVSKMKLQPAKGSRRAIRQESALEDPRSAGESSDDESEASSDQEARKRAAKKAGKRRSQEAEDSDDEELREAAEDWDTSEWTMTQIEASCRTLMEECYTTDDRKRRVLALGMMSKLIGKHSEAKRFMERSLDAIVADGIPSLLKAQVDHRPFRLAHLLAALAPLTAEDLSRLNVAPRLLRIMLQEMDIAARVIKFRLLFAIRKLELKALPKEIATHRRTQLLMQRSELSSKWRGIREGTQCGRLPPETKHAYLKVLLPLTQKKRCPSFHRMNRVHMVAGQGLLTVRKHLRHGDRSQGLACRLLYQVAQESVLLYELLKAMVPAYLTRLLPAVLKDGPEALFEVLDVVDALAFAATRHSDVNAEALGGMEQQRLSAHPSDPEADEMQQHLSIPSDAEVVEAIRSKLCLPELVSFLVVLLNEKNGAVFLGAVMILHKLACTACYPQVLEEVLAYGGRGLERLVDGLTSQEDVVPRACLWLLQQLYSRQEGRDGIRASEGVNMLRPLCQGRQSHGTNMFLLGLTCCLGLGRRGICHAALPRSAGFSNPLAAAAPEDLIAALYADLYQAVTAPTAQETVTALVEMGTLEPVMLFLTRPEKEEHIFQLPAAQASLGAVVLHGLCVSSNACPVVFQRATLRYLCYTVQTNYNDLVSGELPKGQEVGLLFRSLQLSCYALAFMADHGQAPDALRQVADSLIETCALNEVAAILQLPSIKDTPMYVDMARNVCYGAALVASICPIPAAERDPFTKFAFPVDERESLHKTQPLLERIMKTVAPPLVSTLGYADGMHMVAHLCSALTRLAATGATCETLLSVHHLIKPLIRLAPRTPALLPADKKISPTRTASTSPSRPRQSTLSLKAAALLPGAPLGFEVTYPVEDPPTLQLLELPAPYFSLLASVARTGEGRRAIQSGGLLKRCLERLALRHDGPDGGNTWENLLCWSHMSVLLSRLANSFDADSGVANEFILAKRYAAIPLLVGMTRLTGPEPRFVMPRYNATLALEALSRDTVNVIPHIVAAGGAQALCQLVTDETVPLPLVKLAVHIMTRISTFPGGGYNRLLMDGGAPQQLTRIANIHQLKLQEAAGSIQKSRRSEIGDLAREAAYTIVKTAASASRETTRQSERRPPSQPPGPPPFSPLHVHSAPHHTRPHTSATQPATSPNQPGTYFACGPTACGSVSAVGGHGSLEGPARHPDFVMRSSEQPDSDVADGGNLWDTGGAAQVGTSPGGGEMATPLALLSAREEGFRRELLRHKQYYGFADPPGGPRSPISSPGIPHPGTKPASSPVARSAHSRRGRNSPGAARRPAPRSPGFGTRQSPPVLMQSPPKTPGPPLLEPPRFARLDVHENPFLKSTRPPGPKPPPPPPPELSQTPPRPHTSNDSPAQGAHAIAEKLEGTGRYSPGGREYVTFARPSTHTGACRDPASPEPSKGPVAVPGRFVTRGFLLDPTFADRNPPTRLPEISPQLAKSQQAAVPIQSGTELLLHESGAFAHKVYVKGRRPHSPKPLFDDLDRTLVPLTVDHVYDSAAVRHHPPTIQKTL